MIRRPTVAGTFRPTDAAILRRTVADPTGTGTADATVAVPGPDEPSTV